LTVQIPAESPRLQITAGLHGAAISALTSGWILELENDEDGYHTQIYLRAH
jgi:hypothetical protein